eukprot:CAMPEP_0118971280 /NCGR_PEP_ID=MMETSP1173-20130426/7951_1 /TAXON_ID=1034831 /ORGANISM="Rhizochromulina marina cf, Strain CCMP1243" /LENGTH=153 /DNA_ID=CAMNT_0006920721 /DNA_START=459 /DNA_END=916 /DNA_ORIENTATION=+
MPQTLQEGGLARPARACPAEVGDDGDDGEQDRRATGSTGVFLRRFRTLRSARSLAAPSLPELVPLCSAPPPPALPTLLPLPRCFFSHGVNNGLNLRFGEPPSLPPLTDRPGDTDIARFLLPSTSTSPASPWGSSGRWGSAEPVPTPGVRRLRV